eukprot:jgi/Chlat1/3309/Chrsp22S08802
MAVNVTLSASTDVEQARATTAKPLRTFLRLRRCFPKTTLLPDEGPATPKIKLTSKSVNWSLLLARLGFVVILASAILIICLLTLRLDRAAANNALDPVADVLTKELLNKAIEAVRSYTTSMLSSASAWKALLESNLVDGDYSVDTANCRVTALTWGAFTGAIESLTLALYVDVRTKASVGYSKQLLKGNVLRMVVHYSNATEVLGYDVDPKNGSVYACNDTCLCDGLQPNNTDPFRDYASAVWYQAAAATPMSSGAISWTMTIIPGFPQAGASFPNILHNVYISEKDQRKIYLTDDANRLIASSLPESLNATQYLYPTQLPDPVIQQAAFFLQGKADVCRPNCSFTTELAGSTWYVTSEDFVVPNTSLPITGVFLLPRSVIMQPLDDSSRKTIIVVSVVAASIFVLGTILTLLCTWRVSNEIRLKAKLSELNKDYLAAKERAEEKSREKSLFLANMSHELRTPLTGIIGFVDILMTESLTQGQMDTATQVKQCSTTLLQLLNNVLDLSKIESGRLDLDGRKTDLYELLEGVVDMFSLQSASKGVDLILSIDGVVPRVVYADAGRLRQIFMNLISNAVKFTNQGHVHLNGRVIGAWALPEEEQSPVMPPAGSWKGSNPNKSCDVGATAADADVSGLELKSGQRLGAIKLLFEIDDSGIGIPKDKWQEVFEDFVQADKSTSRNYGGTGLGLSIVRALIEKMNGHIQVTKKEGPGTRIQFTVTLLCPVVPMPDTPDAQQYTMTLPPESLPFRTLMIDQPGTLPAASSPSAYGRKFSDLKEKFPHLSHQRLSNDTSVDFMEGSPSMDAWMPAYDAQPSLDLGPGLALVVMGNSAARTFLTGWLEQHRLTVENAPDWTGGELLLMRLRAEELSLKCVMIDLRAVLPHSALALYDDDKDHPILERRVASVNQAMEGLKDVTLVWVVFPSLPSKIRDLLLSLGRGATREPRLLQRPLHASRVQQAFTRPGRRSGSFDDGTRSRMPMTRVKAPPANRPMQLKDISVLVAEDNPVNQKLLQSMLVMQGAKVHIVSNGQLAVDAMGNWTNYDVVLMDCMMPVMDGLSATAAIREAEQSSNRRPIPIVALTANAMTSDRDRCLQVGMSHFLTKPISIKDLIATVLSAVGEHRSSTPKVTVAAEEQTSGSSEQSQQPKQ